MPVRVDRYEIRTLLRKSTMGDGRAATSALLCINVRMFVVGAAAFSVRCRLHAEQSVFFQWQTIR